MKKLQSFRSKLMLLFSLSIILPISIMILFLCNYFTDILSTQNTTQFRNTLNSVSNNINTYLDDLKRLTLTPYMYKDIASFMEFINNGSYEQNTNDIDRFVKSRNYSSTLNKLINHSREDILGITFIPYKNTSNGYLVSKYYDTLSKVETPDYYDEWIDNAIKLDGDTFFTPVHSAYYNNSGNSYSVFSIMRIIKNLDTNKVIGIIKIDAKENNLKDIISSVNITSNSKFMLLDQNGQAIYSKNYLSTDPISSKLLSDTTFTKAYNIVTTPINSSNWILLYLGSKKDLYNEVNIVFSVVIFISILFIIIAILFFRVNSNKIVESVTNITSTMKKVRNGDLSVKCELSDNDELKFIAEALNKMIVNLDSHIQNEQASLLAVKNAEYLALQSQINPHFLCNTLNGFVALNRIGEKKLLEDSIIQLSSLYRYTCSTSNISVIKEEFLFIERYLTLQKLRFDEMIDFKITLSKEIENEEIPKLIIQPLVENSIKYGFKNYTEPIFIEICGYYQSSTENTGKAIITITDNGVGFSTENSFSNTSTGLNNVKERIEYFRKGASFKIESTINTGTTCYIEIPIQGGNIDENTNRR